MEIWYTLAGNVCKKVVQESIRTINDEIYSKPIQSLRFLIASGTSEGEIDASITLYTYLKALPLEVETIAFGGLDTAATVGYLGGKKRTGVENCQFYFREGRYTVQDPTAPVHALEESVAVFRRELNELIHIIASETANDSELVAHMLRRSKIMNVEEARDFGLTHTIVDTLPLQQQEKFGFSAEHSALHEGG